MSTTYLLSHKCSKHIFLSKIMIKKIPNERGSKGESGYAMTPPAGSYQISTGLDWYTVGKGLSLELVPLHKLKQMALLHPLCAGY